MEWAEQFENLTDPEKEGFREVLNTLLSQTFVLERKFNTYKGNLETNRYYRFIERNRDIVAGYLRIGGWELAEDPANGVFYIKSESQGSLVSLDKLTTMIFLVLRLMFEEKKGTASLNRQVLVTIQDLLDKLKVLQLMEKKPSEILFRASLAKLRKFSLIDKVGGGDYTHPDTSLIIYPSVIHLVDSEVLAAVIKEFTAVEDGGEVELDSEDETS
jgi:hypothetical protein